MGESGEKKHMTARRCAHARTHARTHASMHDLTNAYTPLLPYTVHIAYRIPCTAIACRMPHARPVPTPADKDEPLRDLQTRRGCLGNVLPKHKVLQSSYQLPLTSAPGGRNSAERIGWVRSGLLHAPQTRCPKARMGIVNNPRTYKTKPQTWTLT